MNSATQGPSYLEDLAFRTRTEQSAAVRAAQAAQATFVDQAGLSSEYSRADGQAGLHGATSIADVKHWLAQGAPIDGVQRITNYADSSQHWETPLLTALVDGNLAAARELLARGADPNAISMTVEYSDSGFTSEEFTFTALHMMASRRKHDCVDLLLTTGADANLRSSDGSSPIRQAAEKDDLVGVRSLLHAGAETDLVDFKGVRPVDVAGPATRDLLMTAAPINKWQMDTPPATALFPHFRGDLDFERPIYVTAPDGWRRPADMTEAFLVAAALEYQERAKIDRYHAFSNRVFEQLPAWCRYDPLKDLSTFGGSVDAETSEQITDPNLFWSARSRGETYSRFPLLQLLWEYIDEALPRVIGNDRDYLSVLQRLVGVNFGKLGTALFLASLRQDLQGDDGLSNAEAHFAAGRPFEARSGNGVMIQWDPNANETVDSIWYVCFRLIEANSPEYYLRKFAHRVPAVSAMTREAGRLGEVHGRQNCWPGWDFVAAHS